MGVQTPTASRNKLLLICITVHVCFCRVLSEYASPHFRPPAWCLHYNWAWSTGHHKWEALHHFPWHAVLQALSTGKWKGKLARVWREAEAAETGKLRVTGSGTCSNMPAAPGLIPCQWQALNTVQEINQYLFEWKECKSKTKQELGCTTGRLWSPRSTCISTLQRFKFCQKKRAFKPTKTHLFQKKPVKEKSQRIPKHTLISGKAAGVSLAHGMWCWWDCWNCPDITVCVQLHSGSSQLAVWYTMRIHSLWVWQPTVLPKIEGWGVGVKAILFKTALSSTL